MFKPYHFNILFFLFKSLINIFLSNYSILSFFLLRLFCEMQTNQFLFVGGVIVIIGICAIQWWFTKQNSPTLNQTLSDLLKNEQELLTDS